MATIEAVERALIREWDAIFANRDTDPEQANKVLLQDMGSTLAYLLNFYLEREPTWNEFGADDLLDPQCEFPSSSEMKVTGLMCWGSNHNYLSPFVGVFERFSDKNRVKDFTLFFAAGGPDTTSFTRPYTRSAAVKQELFESRPKTREAWPHVYRRADLFGV